MHLFNFLIFVSLLYSFSVKGQTTEYQNLVNTAVKHKGGLFVGIKPITKIHLDKEDVRANYDDLDSTLKNIDTTIFFQIIDNSKTVDTFNWTDAELPHSILVRNRDEEVQLHDVIRKLNITDKKTLRFYRRHVNQFNSLEPIDKSINYYSRPVFDSTKRFAIVQWHNGHGSLGGGGGVELYELIDGSWRNVGTISRWNY